MSTQGDLRSSSPAQWPPGSQDLSHTSAVTQGHKAQVANLVSKFSHADCATDLPLGAPHLYLPSLLLTPPRAAPLQVPMYEQRQKPDCIPRTSS